MAEDLERISKKMVQKLKATLGISATNKKRTRDEDNIKSDEEEEDDDDEAEVSFDDRLKFTDNVRKLTIEQMTQLIKLIQEECPSVIDDIDSDKLQIKVDFIDKVSFEKFMEFTRGCLNKDENCKENNEKDAKMKPADAEDNENSKSNQDDCDEPMDNSNDESPDKSSKQDDEESKHEHSIDSSKYGPEGKRMKLS